MPLKLVPPRKGKSSNYRGTHLGVSVNQTARTPDEKLTPSEKLRFLRTAAGRG